MILVTGAGGTVGSEVVKQLGAAGVKVRAGFHSAQNAEEARRNGIDGIVLDFAKLETLRPALASVDRVFLVSGNVPHQTELELNVVREAKRAGVMQVVKNSVWGAETDGFSFAKIHHPVEKEIVASGMAYTLLRPNGYMQNMNNSYGLTIRKQAAFYLPASDARVSHIDARDVARVAAAVLTDSGYAAQGQRYELSGPEALSYYEIAEKLSAVAGREISFVDISDQDFMKSTISSGMPKAAACAVLELFHYYITGAASRVTHNVQTLTGHPARTFDQYARDYANAFRGDAPAQQGATAPVS
ncbi:MAG TPA: NmrA family NAD(P)-binding protein [Candidatus Dormibacteraeota bacterium]|nr:NmrA family NAD(P)-binding protein [Candidatus Dormibacteraeota bacterium]